MTDEEKDKLLMDTDFGMYETIKSQEQTIKSQEQTIKSQEQTIKSQEQVIESLKNEIKERGRRIDRLTDLVLKASVILTGVR
jgi:hypothetical protein